MEHRELTRQERMAIRALVIKWCSNYDREYGCLAMGWPCYMLSKCWTGACCRYFREAVLPLDPGLEAALARDNTVSFRPCPMCGRPVPRDRRHRYCSGACRNIALRNQKRAYMRKIRGVSVEN